MKVGVVTVARSDWGIWQSVLQGLLHEPSIDLQLIAYGNHLGDILALGYPVTRFEFDEDDSALGMLNVISKLTTCFGNTFYSEDLDLVMVLGDRFEMFAAAVAALPFRIPVVHLHGGENTYGAFDNQLRHAISHLSHLHCVAHKQARDRLIAMGEQSWRILLSGAPGLDQIPANMSYARDGSLIVLHPTTLESGNPQEQMEMVLDAVADEVPGHIVVIHPNRDPGFNEIIDAITKRNANFQIYENLPRPEFLSLMNNVRVMVGNSSAGIIEAPSFELPFVNIGSRQDGRVRGFNVISVGFDADEIRDGIRMALSPSFTDTLQGTAIHNPYVRDGQASRRIINFLAEQMNRGRETLVVKR